MNKHIPINIKGRRLILKEAKCRVYLATMYSKMPILQKSEKIEDKIADLHDGTIALPAIVVVIRVQDRSLLFVSPQGQDAFGYTIEEFANLGKLYRKVLLHEDDEQDYLPKFKRLMEPGDSTNEINFFVRIHLGRARWQWYLGSSRVWYYNERQEPQYLICTLIEVDPEHKIAFKAQRLLEENTFLEEINPLLKNITARERQILKLVIAGNSSKRIAEILGISELTAKTHRKNLKRKLKIQNNFELSKFAEALDKL